MQRMVSSLTAALALGWLLIVALAYFFQDRFVYLPQRTLDGSPAEIGLPFESLNFSAADGVRLHGWYVPARAKRGVLLSFYGNAGNISHRLDSLRLFNRLGLTTFIIDYRGYGLSEGSPSELGIYKDAEAAWRVLTEERGHAAGEIVLFGRSLGGAVAIWLATRHRPAALIAESTFTSMRDLARVHYPYLPTGLLVRIGYPSLSRIPLIKCPALIVHSKQDEIVPYALGERLFQAAKEPKNLLTISGGHNEGFLISRKVYVGGLDAFLEEMLRP